MFLTTVKTRYTGMVPNFLNHFCMKLPFACATMKAENPYYPYFNIWKTPNQSYEPLNTNLSLFRHTVSIMSHDYSDYTFRHQPPVLPPLQQLHFLPPFLLVQPQPLQPLVSQAVVTQPGLPQPVLAQVLPPLLQLQV